MSYPVGHFSCKLDAKGRLMIPSDFKEQMGTQAEEGFVLRPGSNKKCLELFTRKDWDEVQDKFRTSLNPFNPQHEAVIRKYNAGARPVKLDASGRLQIPKELMDKGFLTKDVIITSVTTKMEIWDKALYETAVESLDDELFLQILSDIK
jgi:MraZ protein